MAGQAPENQDSALFDLFGRKKEERKDKMHDDQMMQAPALYTHHQAHIAPYYLAAAAAAQLGAATHNQARSAPYYTTQSLRGQYFTAGETEKQQHTGVPGKFHSTASRDSSSSSEEEEEAGQRKTGGSKKKGGNDKLPGGHHSS
uniref:Dehydrin n=1 Tax=Pinus pinaster TaxID=71647 RepID=A0A088N413_PINPS|nr:dehydrin [Pinus pinaster]AIN43972.1 dehydrin [Pinus pinaster]